MMTDKQYSLIRDYDNHSSAKQRICVTCGNLATREILFLVSDVSVVERYCETCSVGVVKENKKGFYL
jgi:hypothetical protein